MDGSPTYTEVGGQKECTDLLLIGKTGTGKSSTGNSILGRPVFKSMASPTACTKEAQIEYSDVGDRIVKVVDGPGVIDTSLSPTDALQLVISAVQYAIAANPRGYHAILLVVRIGRFTKEDYTAVQQLKGIFGSDFVERFAIIVVTFGDTFNPEENNVNTFEEWCSKQEGEFRNLLVECKQRVILFDNNRKTDVMKLNDQRQHLFKMIDSLSQAGERYSDKHFQMAKAERDRVLIETKLPVIREESVMEASLIIQQLGKIQLDEPEQQLPRLRVVKGRADRLVQGIINQDRGTGVLHEVIENARNISRGVDEQINNASEAAEIKAQRKQCIQQRDQLQVTQEVYTQQPQDVAQRQLQMQVTELQSQLEESQARYEELLEDFRQANKRMEIEYDSIARRQNNSLLPMIIKGLCEIATQVAKFFFR